MLLIMVPWILLAWLAPRFTPLTGEGAESMADLPTIALGTRSATHSTADTEVVGSEPVLELIASAVDASFVRDITNSTHTGIGAFDLLGNMPADFGTMDTLSVELRSHLGSAPSNNTWDSLTAQIVNGGTGAALTNEVTVRSAIATTPPVNTLVNFTGVQAGSKAEWDGAVILLRFNITRNKGGDSVEERVTAGELTGTYTPAIAPAYDQEAYRFRNDDGSEAAATWMAAENVDVNPALDTNFRVRFAIEETAGGSESLALHLRQSINGGGYTAVSESTAVKLVASSHVANEEATTDQLGGAGTFRAGQVKEAGADTSVVATLQGNDHTEHEWVLLLDSAQLSADDVVTLRLYQPLGVVLDTYTRTPSIMVQAAGQAETFQVATVSLGAQDLSASVGSVSQTFQVATADTLARDLTPPAQVSTFEVVAVALSALDLTATLGAVAGTFDVATATVSALNLTGLLTVRLPPVAIEEGGGVVGTVADIDEVEPDTGDWLELPAPGVLVLRAQTYGDPEDHRSHRFLFMAGGDGVATLTPVWRTGYVGPGDRGTVITTGVPITPTPTPTVYELALDEAEAATVAGADYTNGLVCELIAGEG